MDPREQWIETELEELRQAQRFRRAAAPPPGLLNFSSNDYLNLAPHHYLAPRRRGARRVGTDVGAGQRQIDESYR